MSAPTEDPPDAVAPADMRRFVERHGLGHLPAACIARMAVLAPAVAGFGARIRRPANKEDAPAPEFRVR